MHVHYERDSSGFLFPMSFANGILRGCGQRSETPSSSARGHRELGPHREHKRRLPRPESGPRTTCQEIVQRSRAVPSPLPGLPPSGRSCRKAPLLTAVSLARCASCPGRAPDALASRDRPERSDPGSGARKATVTPPRNPVDPLRKIPADSRVVRAGLVTTRWTPATTVTPRL